MFVAFIKSSPSQRRSAGQTRRGREERYLQGSSGLGLEDIHSLHHHQHRTLPSMDLHLTLQGRDIGPDGAYLSALSANRIFQLHLSFHLMYLFSSHKGEPVYDHDRSIININLFSRLSDYDSLLALDDGPQLGPVSSWGQQSFGSHRRESLSDNIASLPTFIFKASMPGKADTHKGSSIRSCEPRTEASVSMMVENAQAREGGSSFKDLSIVQDNTSNRREGEKESHGSSSPPPSSMSPHAPTCVICLEVFENGQGVMTLPCIHQFHESCITPYLRPRGARVVCPVCKTPCFS